CAVGRRAIGAEFLVGDQLAGLVELETHRAKVVGVLVARDVGGGGDGKGVVDGLGLDEAHAACIVTDVEGLPLESELGAYPLTVQLETTEIDALVGRGTDLVDADLADALTCGVVGEV